MGVFFLDDFNMDELFHNQNGEDESPKPAEEDGSDSEGDTLPYMAYLAAACSLQDQKSADTVINNALHDFLDLFMEGIGLIPRPDLPFAVATLKGLTDVLGQTLSDWERELVQDITPNINLVQIDAGELIKQAKDLNKEQGQPGES